MAVLPRVWSMTRSRAARTLPGISSRNPDTRNRTPFRSSSGASTSSVSRSRSMRPCTPHSRAAWRVRRRASRPARWPSRRDRPRSCAHRPFPSIIMATWRGTRVGSREARRSASRDWSSPAPRGTPSPSSHEGPGLMPRLGSRRARPVVTPARPLAAPAARRTPPAGPLPPPRTAGGRPAAGRRASSAADGSLRSPRSATRRPGGSPAPPPAGTPPRQADAASDLHDLLLFGRQQRVDLPDEPVGELLQLVDRPSRLVLRELPGLLEPFQLLLVVPADVPDGHPRLLGLPVDELHQVPPPLPCEGRDGEPDHRAVVRGSEPELALLDGPLDLPHEALVPGLDHQQPWLRRCHGGHLRDGRRHAVVVHGDALQEGWAGPAGPDAGELPPRRIHGLLHVDLRIRNDRMHAYRPLSPTRVPTSSPSTARRRFPGRVMSKTMMGILLSMHRDVAVASMTLRPRLRTSMYSRVLKRTASALCRGSLS